MISCRPNHRACASAIAVPPMVGLRPRNRRGVTVMGPSGVVTSLSFPNRNDSDHDTSSALHLGRARASYSPRPARGQIKRPLLRTPFLSFCPPIPWARVALYSRQPISIRSLAMEYLIALHGLALIVLAFVASMIAHSRKPRAFRRSPHEARMEFALMHVKLRPRAGTNRTPSEAERSAR